MSESHEEFEEDEAFKSALFSVSPSAIPVKKVNTYVKKINAYLIWLDVY